MHRIVRARSWVVRHQRPLLWGGIVVVALLLAVQLFYPTDRLPLNAKIDGLNVSGWKMKDATWQLNKLAAQQQITIRLGNSQEAYESASPADIGLKITNDARVKRAEYAWWARLIPGSLFWYGVGMDDELPEYSSDKTRARAYLNTALGNSCDIPPKDATLTFKDDRLTVVGAKIGGSCKEDEAIKALATVRPVPGTSATVVIPVEEKQPEVSDEMAQELANSLNERTAQGVKLTVAGKTQVISQKEVLSWLIFTPKDGTLQYAIDAKKANGYLASEVTPKVAKPAGTTRITTRDFTVVSQVNGATGQTLAVSATLAQVKSILEGTQSIAKASTTPLAPKVVYTRSYTKTSTGIAAMIKHYDDDHAGTFGVAFQELGGRGLAATHNSTQQFTTASTYKLFVAYGTLRKVDAGKWKWADANIANGRNLATCFDDMIVKSDNACAEALLKKLGYSELTKDINALGLGSSGFVAGDTPHTTAGDLGLFLSKLQGGLLPIKSESRSRLLDAMKRNVYRQGIPAGASGQTADKVGFLWGLLHDAAIVYSPKGTYVLVILTDGSTWANIAELTSKIEALR